MIRLPQRRLFNVFKRTILLTSRSSETIAFHSRHPSLFNLPPLSIQASIFVPRSKSKFCYSQNDENSNACKKDGLVKVDDQKQICDPTPCNVKPDDKATPQKNIATEVPKSPVKLINPIIVWEPTVKPTHCRKMSDVKSVKKIDCVKNSMDTSSKPVDLTRPGKVDNCNSLPFNDDVNPVSVKCSKDGIIFKSDDKPTPEKDFAIEIPKSPVKLVNPIIVPEPTAKPTHDRKMSNARTVKKVDCVASSMKTSFKQDDLTLPGKVDKCNTTVVTETSSRNVVRSVNNSQSVACVQKKTKSTESVNRATEKIELKNSPTKCATNGKSPIPMNPKDCGVKNVATEKIELKNAPTKCATNVKSSIPMSPKDCAGKNVATEKIELKNAPTKCATNVKSSIPMSPKDCAGKNVATEYIELKNVPTKCATNVKSSIPMSPKDCAGKNVATEYIELKNAPTKCGTNVKSSISTCPKDGVIKKCSEYSPNPLDLSELVKPFKSWKYIEEIHRENTSTKVPTELNGKAIGIKDFVRKTITDSVKNMRLWMECRFKQFKK